jgi:hypothetical protein
MATTDLPDDQLDAATNQTTHMVQPSVTNANNGAINRNGCMTVPLQIRHAH